MGPGWRGTAPLGEHGLRPVRAHELPVVLSAQCHIDIPETCGCLPGDIARALKEMSVMPEDELREMRVEALRLVSQEFAEDTLLNKRVSLYLSKG
jgi:hypothetical protein